MKFCKNCGHELRDNAKVCTNCGTAVIAAVDVENKEPSYVTSDKASHKPMDPKKKKKLIILLSTIAVLIIALFIAYKVLENMASPDAALDNISEAVTNQDAGAFQKAVNTDISKEEATAYFNYVDTEIGLSQYQTMINEQKTYLNDGTGSTEIYDGIHTLLSIKQNGSKYVFFDDYEFTIPKLNVYVEESGGLDTFEYELNGETVSWNTSDTKFNELIPGKYNFEGTGIINESEEYNASVQVNFAENYDSIEGVLKADLYNVELSVPMPYHYGIEFKKENISLTMNGEPFAADEELDENPITGPFKFDEEYVFEGSVEYGGETFKMTPVTLNLNAESEELIADYDDSIPYYPLAVKFDEDAVNEQHDKLQKKEQADENREAFEEDMESHTEELVRGYLRALESMYMFDDIGEVEPFIADGADILTVLQNNLDNDAFGNMNIQRVSFSNYSKDGNSITIDAETRRLHDGIKKPVTYPTRYHIQYDPETLEMKITAFDDL